MIDASSPSLVRTRPISGLLSLWHSTLGKKYVMAITGFILWGYVILHLWGNLKIFLGPEQINQWGVFLRIVGDPVFTGEQLLWAARIILLAAVVLHIVSAYQLTRRDWAARPVAYATRRNLESTFASRTMRWGGVIIGLFIVFHVLDLTTGTMNPGFQRGEIYSNVVRSFSRWYVSLVYILAVLALGLHLYHGIWSMFQTLGWNSARSNAILRNAATLIALVLTAGNLAIPVSVLLGIVR